MDRPKSKYVRRTLGVIGLAAITGAAASTEWVLMGRHGECAPLSSLARKGPEFRGLQTPYDPIDRMRAAGHKVEVKEHTTPAGPMVEITVAAKEIAVMVVTADLCKQMPR